MTVYPFDHAYLRVPCPRCTFKVHVRFRLAQLGGAAFCPCCKARIHFVDDKVSGHRARRSVHNSLTELHHELQKLDTTIQIGPARIRGLGGVKSLELG